MIFASDTEVIWNQLSTRLRFFVLRHVADEAAAEDILQDVFLSIHSHALSLRDEQKLQSWIYQITRNAIADYYRRRKPLVELSEALETPDNGDEDLEKQLIPCIRATVNHLPAKYRQVLLLTEFQGLTQQELANQLGLSLSGAKSRVQRAREQLKATLLECCQFDLDRHGTIIDYYPRCCNSEE